MTAKPARDEMALTHYRMGADGELRSATERAWSAAGTCRIARDRATATAEMHLTTDGDEVTLAVTWRREPPDEGRYGTRWTYHDAHGGRWSVEYGYDGRWWCLFGPDGIPWGSLLQNAIAKSLTEATEYIARTIARARDLERFQ
ncbi:hypothetical protein [Dactylosporangium sp. CA-139066]|uniref:hypothetical protein n=1 Tax=Dactylosporangium sp. CA-139066 TaxID=3239930 RepID=UPI003D8EE2ED